MCLHAFLGSNHEFGPFIKLQDQLALAWLWLNHQELIFMTIDGSKSPKGQLLCPETLNTQAFSTMGSKGDIKYPNEQI